MNLESNKTFGMPKIAFLSSYSLSCHDIEDIQLEYLDHFLVHIPQSTLLYITEMELFKFPLILLVSQPCQLLVFAFNFHEGFPWLVFQSSFRWPRQVNNIIYHFCKGQE